MRLVAERERQNPRVVEDVQKEDQLIRSLFG